MTDEEIVREESIKKFVKNQRHKTNALKRKLQLKTRALWIASGWLSNSGVIKNKTQEQIYEAIKFMAAQELATENKNKEEK